jgi:hypothetical protein
MVLCSHLTALSIPKVNIKGVSVCSLFFLGNKQYTNDLISTIDILVIWFLGVLPQVGGSIPRVRGSIPEAGGSIPRVRGSIPEARGSIPRVRGSIPEARGLIPRVRGSIPIVWG